jgi:hypothetical protein
LLPYIVISYYDRYAFPVLAAQALLTFWGIERVLSLLRPAVPVAEFARIRGTG